MTETQRTWDDLTHAERAKRHRAQAEIFRQHKRADHSSLYPVLMAEAEDRAAEAEEAIAAEEAAAVKADRAP